ncbi:MAG: 3-phosphoshikimate 1-carboxyvinyltransferase, partial [Treponema sp.]|nr:3-phosphoshikimate 1-carboxyvinyltransferase [Treponema sp.]
MRAYITPHVFGGCVRPPPSKSHTIRRLVMASLTGDVSRIENPLDSLDGQSCASACGILGAKIEESRNGGNLAAYTVHGVAPGLHGPAAAPARSRKNAPAVIDVGNSGTTLFLGLAAASLFSVPFTFTGDDQIARRSAAPLLEALAALGVAVESKNGCTPITVRGPWKGGKARISCPTSQYLSALLIASPLAPAVTEIEVPLLNEKPYVEMTLSYLKAQGLCAADGDPGGTGTQQAGVPSVSYAPDFSRFRIAGGASYRPVNGPVPGDFSSAAFPAAAAVISGGGVTLLGLDPDDTQGDKVFFEYLSRMGCDVTWENLSQRRLSQNFSFWESPCEPDAAGGGTGGEWRLSVSRSGPLRGGVFDLNATPDMLPVMAALGASAEGVTELVNAAHARIKETDRIAVMAVELGKLGVTCREKPDGLVVYGRKPDGPSGGRA